MIIGYKITYKSLETTNFSAQTFKKEHTFKLILMKKCVEMVEKGCEICQGNG